MVSITRCAPLAVLLLAGSLTGCLGDDVAAGGDDVGPDARGPRPETSLNATPPTISNQATARFEFSSDADGATFTCNLVDQPVVACTSPHEVTLADGTWIFEVVASDADGYSDATPARHAWRIDTRTPEVRFLDTPDVVDNSTRAFFDFTTDEVDSVLDCAVDDGAFLPCVPPLTTPPLADGAHRFAIRATDLAGNVTEPAVHAWSIDSSPPDTVIDDAPDGVTAARIATITFSAPDAAAGSAFRCARGADPAVVCASPWTLSDLADGYHYVRVWVVEPSGNVDPTPATRSWTVDTTPPVATITGGPQSAQRDPTPTFTFSTTGAAAIACRITGAGVTADFAPCSSPTTSAPLGDGPYTFELRASDLAGNQTIVTQGFAVDTIAPVLTLDGPSGTIRDNRPPFAFTASESVTWSCKFDWNEWTGCTSPQLPPSLLSEGSHTFHLTAHDRVGFVTTVTRQFTVDRSVYVGISDGPGTRTDDTTPRFAFYVTDATTIECRVDSGELAPCTSPYTAAALTAGNHTFSVRVVDALGNTNTASRAFTVDTTPLEITVTGGPTGDTPDSTPLFTYAVTGAVASVSCRHDARAFADCPITYAEALADGPHTFEIRGVGDSGTVVSATRSFTVDTIAPGVSFTDGPSGTISTPTATFAFATSGNPAVTECRLFRDGNASGPYLPCTSPHTVDLPATAAPIAYVFEVRARDAAGNQWSAYRTFSHVTP